MAPGILVYKEAEIKEQEVCQSGSLSAESLREAFYKTSSTTTRVVVVLAAGISTILPC